MRVPTPPLYPFLAALYPVVALAAENSEEYIEPVKVMQACIVSVSVAGIGWIVAGFVTRNSDRRGLLALVLVVFFGWYGIFSSALKAIPPLALLSEYRASLSLWSILLVGIAWLVIRAPRFPKKLAPWLNVTGFILLLFPVSTLARDAWTRNGGELTLAAVAADSTAAIAESPDIYLLILDKYTGNRALARNYGYDNGWFVDSLEARGFFVPSASRASYVHTAQALASLLNWTHLDETARQAGQASRSRSLLYSMIENSRARSFLSQRGYEFVFFPTPYGGTTHNRYADLQIPEPFEASIDFSLAWLLSTPLAPAMTWACTTLGCEGPTSGRFPYPPETAGQIERKFEVLAELAARSGPQFVLAHLLVPHEPFIFRADCSHRDPIWPPDVGFGDSLAAKRAYVDQIRCINTMLLDVIDRIQERSERPSVIVLQADHGHGRMIIDPAHNVTVPLGNLSPEQVEERTSVFAAYHIPNGGNRLLYDSITPVNVFPVILNHHFDREISLREDATFWVEPRQPYRFTRVR